MNSNKIENIDEKIHCEFRTAAGLHLLFGDPEKYTHTHTPSVTHLLRIYIVPYNNIHNSLSRSEDDNDDQTGVRATLLTLNEWALDGAADLRPLGILVGLHTHYTQTHIDTQTHTNTPHDHDLLPPASSSSSFSSSFPSPS